MYFTIDSYENVLRSFILIAKTEIYFIIQLYEVGGVLTWRPHNKLNDSQPCADWDRLFLEQILHVSIYTVLKMAIYVVNGYN